MQSWQVEEEELEGGRYGVTSLGDLVMLAQDLDTLRTIGVSACHPCI